MNWKADWIWDDSGEHPRNHWACFRREFTSPKDFDEVKLYITADTAYTIYLDRRSYRFGSSTWLAIRMALRPI